VRRLPPQATPGPMPLYARISRDAQQQEQLTLYCGWEDFHQRKLGDRLYRTVVAQLRARSLVGPLMVAELELSGAFEAGQLQTLHYLEYKRSIEQALRAAEGFIDNASQHG